MSSTRPSGLISIPSRYSVDETVARLTAALSAKGIKLFAIIDHSGEAKEAGLSMPATKVVIFGNPRGGTPLMIAAPSIAIDLPLKLLISEDTHGGTRISWNSPEYLSERHQLPEELMANIAGIATLAQQIAE